MVHIQLVPIKGNAQRCFPHTGYLGLSPLSFQGMLRTRRDPEDRNPVAASSVIVAVRCYEFRLNKAGAIAKQNLIASDETCLWSAANANEPVEVGDWDLPFRISLPVTFGGISTVSHQEYKVSWKIEAVIHHAPMFGLGTRLVKAVPLNILRYSVPPALLPPTQHCVNVPHHPIGPDDPFTVRLHLPQPPPHMAFSHVSIQVDRTLEMPEASPPTSPEAQRISLLGTVFARPSSSGSGASAPAMSSRRHSPTRRSPSPIRPSTSTGVPAARTSTHIIMTTDFPLDPFAAEQHVTLALPRPPSSGHWSLGETSITSLCVSRFFVRLRLHFVSSIPGSPQRDHMELPSAELLVTLPSNVQRREALAKLHASGRVSPPPRYEPAPPSYRHASRDMTGEPQTAPAQPSTPARPVLRRPRTAGSSSSKGPPGRPIRPRRSQEHLALHHARTPSLVRDTHSSPPSASSSASTLRPPAIEIALSPPAPPSPKRSIPPTANDPPARPRTKARLFLNLGGNGSPGSSSGQRVPSGSSQRVPSVSPASALVPGVAEMMTPEHVIAWEQEVDRINSAAQRERVVNPACVSALR
ncbi:hypothetical protein CALVIDRAFT_564997 [Calocera viscosa TUFC12733]|uniref:Uncharacterized protein n=1 Tax=Calocera viscosa (strain TUFC12733) TaxID=1330018 RepID=A0A167L0U3_CALVF|nr:hypothetical protein CALVIDRAFT_564997 [Calocera viscosa TUFC12733]